MSRFGRADWEMFWNGSSNPRRAPFLGSLTPPKPFDRGQFGPSLCCSASGWHQSREYRQKSHVVSNSSFSTDRIPSQCLRRLVASRPPGRFPLEISKLVCAESQVASWKSELLWMKYFVLFSPLRQANQQAIWYRRPAIFFSFAVWISRFRILRRHSAYDTPPFRTKCAFATKYSVK